MRSAECGSFSLTVDDDIIRGFKDCFYSEFSKVLIGSIAVLLKLWLVITPITTLELRISSVLSKMSLHETSRRLCCCSSVNRAATILPSWGSACSWLRQQFLLGILMSMGKSSSVDAFDVLIFVFERAECGLLYRGVLKGGSHSVRVGLQHRAINLVQ